MNYLNKNIKQLVDNKADGKSTVFAKMIGVSSTTMYDIYNGNTKAGGHVILKIAAAFDDVDLNWLIKGERLDLSNNMAEEPERRYFTKQDLYNIHELVDTVNDIKIKMVELERLVIKLQKSIKDQ